MTKLISESLMEYSLASGGDSREVSLNIIKRFKDVITSSINKYILKTTDDLKTLKFENDFDREIDGITVKINNDAYAGSIIKDGIFILDVKLSGTNDGDRCIIDVDSMGIYFKVPNGSEVAEFFDKDELTTSNAFITFPLNKV